MAVAAAALALAGCAGGGAGAPVGRGDALADALLSAPPEADAPGCWHEEDLPARFETVTEQSVGADGRITSVQRQALVQPRRTVWFAVPCEAVTPAFAASLQRALKARGLYPLPVTGTVDAATAAAVRRYQAARGIDSATLSLAAARALGLVAVPLE